MDPFADPLDAWDIAAHWPHLRRHIDLRRPAAIRVLDLLSELQTDRGGSPVPLSAKALAAAHFTGGEAGRARMALAELAELGVVARNRGSGTRPDVWSFRADLAHWRRMRWAAAGRQLGDQIRSCACRAGRAVAARFPGQSRAASGNLAEFWLPAESHTRRPGLLLVDSRGYGAARAATARPRIEQPVDSRGKSLDAGPYTFLLEEPSVLLAEEEDERIEALLRGIEKATRGQQRGPNGRAVWGIQLRRLAAVARGLDLPQAAELGRRLSQVRDSYAVRLVTDAEVLAGEIRRGTAGTTGPGRPDWSAWGVTQG